MGNTAIDMFEHIPERRRFIRSRADVEFQLARITLALSRAPLARRAESLAWFDEAAAGLVKRTAGEHRDYVEERVASIRETFFPTTRVAYPLAHLNRMGRHCGPGSRMQ